MEQSVIILAFFFIYYNVCGLSTTNILRLTYGNESPVLASKCVCDRCGTPITPYYQLPIISFILCKGMCRKCKAKIPVESLCLEIAVLVGMFAISALLSFSCVGVVLSFVYYEVVRIILIVKCRKRNSDFVKQYIIAVLAMLPHLLTTLFVALIYGAVSA